MMEKGARMATEGLVTAVVAGTCRTSPSLSLDSNFFSLPLSIEGLHPPSGSLDGDRGIRKCTREEKKSPKLVVSQTKRYPTIGQSKSTRPQQTYMKSAVSTALCTVELLQGPFARSTLELQRDWLEGGKNMPSRDMVPSSDKVPALAARCTRVDF